MKFINLKDFYFNSFYLNNESLEENVPLEKEDSSV